MLKHLLKGYINVLSIKLITVMIWIPWEKKESYEIMLETLLDGSIFQRRKVLKGLTSDILVSRLIYMPLI